MDKDFKVLLFLYIFCICLLTLAVFFLPPLPIIVVTFTTEIISKEEAILGYFNVMIPVIVVSIIVFIMLYFASKKNGGELKKCLKV